MVQDRDEWQENGSLLGQVLGRREVTTMRRHKASPGSLFSMAQKSQASVEKSSKSWPGCRWSWEKENRKHCLWEAIETILGPGYLIFPAAGGEAGSVGKLSPQRPRDTEPAKYGGWTSTTENTNHSCNTRPTTIEWKITVYWGEKQEQGKKDLSDEDRKKLFCKCPNKHPRTIVKLVES